MALGDSRPDWLVLELSSFQLHDTPSIDPTVGVLTNLAPDHLDRYPDVDAYFADKALLFRHAHVHSRWVVNADDERSRRMVADVPGLIARFSASGRLSDAFLDPRSGTLIVRDEPLLPRRDFRLLGAHNVANALAAALAVMLADRAHESIAEPRGGWPMASGRSAPSRTASSRWASTAVCSGSTTRRPRTSPRRGWRCESMTRPTVLLLGGRHKGEPYGALAAPIAAHCRAVIAYGEAGGGIVRDLGGDGSPWKACRAGSRR